MAHNINRENGIDAMWCVGTQTSAWHLLGQRTPGAQTWEQAAELAHINYTVSKKQLYGSGAPYTPGLIPVDAWGMFRDDNGAFLGAVGARYTPIQWHQTMKFLDTITENIGGAHYDSAGALGRGERIWASIKIPMDFEVTPGDKLLTYLMGITAHDGSSSQLTKISTTRPVCQNTVNAALAGAGQLLKIKHTRTAQERMTRQAELLIGLGKDVKALETKLRRLAEVRMTRESMNSIMERLFPKQEKANQTRRDNIVAEVLSLYERNDNNAFPVIRGTAYNLFNAITEFTDHHRTARAAEGDSEQATVIARATSALFGSGDTLKTDALDVLLEESNTLPLAIG
jgi:phage/plasmid-like protein (TIGR03299 family)